MSPIFTPTNTDQISQSIKLIGFYLNIFIYLFTYLHECLLYIYTYIYI